MRIIAIANQKGGVGKTTTAINLASCLSLLNRKVFLIDLDPQAHASLALGVDVKELNETIYDVLIKSNDGTPLLSDIAIPISENLDLAPSDVVLSAFEQVMAGLPGRENKLMGSVEEVDTEKYDYMIIDCPPSIGLLTFNALKASDEVIITIETSFFSVFSGIDKLEEMINLLTEKVGQVIKVRALATMFDKRNRLDKDLLDELRYRFGDRLFESVIRKTVKLRESLTIGKPIADYDKRCSGFENYMSLTHEVIAEESRDHKARIEGRLEDEKVKLIHIIEGQEEKEEAEPIGEGLSKDATISEVYLSIEEIAEYLDKEVSTIRSWAIDDMIPAEKEGEEWKFNREEIDEWLEKDGNWINAEPKEVVFSYKSAVATVVALAGDFNGWSKDTHLLRKVNSEDWEIEIELQPGKHGYRFIVDGIWVEDPEAGEFTSGVPGTRSAVIEVK